MKSERESVKRHPLFGAECAQVADESAKGWRALFLLSLPED